MSGLRIPRVKSARALNNSGSVCVVERPGDEGKRRPVRFTTGHLFRVRGGVFAGLRLSRSAEVRGSRYVVGCC